MVDILMLMVAIGTELIERKNRKKNELHFCNSFFFRVAGTGIEPAVTRS